MNHSMISMDKELFDLVRETLASDSRIVFAYLYGSAGRLEKANDIDIAVYVADPADAFSLSADIKIALHRKTDLPPDSFDIHILNGLAENGDLFALLHLENVLEANLLIADNNPDLRADFLETYGRRYRECTGLFREVLA